MTLSNRLRFERPGPVAPNDDTPSGPPEGVSHFLGYPWLPCETLRAAVHADDLPGEVAGPRGGQEGTTACAISTGRP